MSGLSPELEAARQQCLAAIRDGRLLCLPQAAVFESREEALIRLALNGAASEGEIENSAIKLIRALRARNLDAETVISGRELAAKSLPKTNIRELGAERLPWGKFVNCRVDSVPLSYLRFCLWKLGKASFTKEVIRPYFDLLKGNV